jgi:serpin B
MRKTSAAAALSAAALALSACASASSAGLGATILAGKVRTVSAGSLTAADVGAAQRTFGLDVLKALCANGDPNVTFSPSSLADALGLLDAGSSGASRTAMATLLHLPAWGDDLVAAQRARTQALAALAADKNERVVISNHIWAQTGTKPTQAYLDDVKTAFDADLRALDFAKDAGQATDTINASVSHDTDGMIPKLYDDPLDPSTVDVLTNAVVLDAKWADPFNPDSGNEAFTTSTGRTVQTPMMSTNEQTFPWTGADSWQAATLAYQGGKLSAVAILPPKGTTTCGGPPAATLTSLLGPAQGNTTVLLPRLKLAQTHDLLSTLKGLGMPDEGFPGLTPNASVTGVVQKVVMDVDEKGTKAAAATGVGIASSALVGGHQLLFDRPFLLVIRDTATGSPLFLTWVGDPTQS